MTKFFSIKVGLKPSQSEIIDILRNAKGDVIQTSGGLCVKIDQSLADLQKALGVGVTITELQAAQVLADETTSADVKAFLSK